MAKKYRNIKELSHRIDELRKEKGYTIREFAELCEISKTQVNDMGNDGVDFRYSTLVKIAKGLKISISELLNL